MATFRIKLFAHLRESVGQAEMSVEVDTPIAMSNIIAQAADNYPEFKKYYTTSAVLMAVNHCLVEPDSLVNSGDEIALFPPVTGG